MKEASKEEYEHIIEKMLRCGGATLCEDCRTEAIEALGEKKACKEVQIEIKNEDIIRLSLLAHEENITLNALCVKILSQGVKNSDNECSFEKSFNDGLKILKEDNEKNDALEYHSLNEALSALRDGKKVYYFLEEYDEEPIYNLGRTDYYKYTIRTRHKCNMENGCLIVDGKIVTNPDSLGDSFLIEE